MPYWKKVIDEKHLPVFVAYGELDAQDNVPVKASIARFREHISSYDLSLHVYQGTGHSFLDSEKWQIAGTSWSRPCSMIWMPGSVKTLPQGIRENGFLFAIRPLFRIIRTNTGD